MARLPLDLDRETLVALTDRAIRERRPIIWQAEVMLRQALGLPFPYAGEPADKPDEKTEEGRQG